MTYYQQVKDIDQRPLVQTHIKRDEYFHMNDPLWRPSKLRGAKLTERLFARIEEQTHRVLTNGLKRREICDAIEGMAPARAEAAVEQLIANWFGTIAPCLGTVRRVAAECLRPRLVIIREETNV